ncbi:hypothetical protein OAK89_02300 [Akkermansiaceae bacterium]|nr:hypothetical protein [Akkermansiaceae bacterium]MDB4319699.1 hypothetical protein [bacterium]MDC0287033.1 hypothetical protein [Akkermansiaceae bacterium]
MTKIERLKKNGLKAGVKKSKKEGHVLTKEDLLKMKVQVMPSPFRIASASLGVFVIAYSLLAGGFSIFLFLLGLLFLMGGIYGYRKTLSKVVDGMDVVSGPELIEVVFEGVAGAVTSIFD